MNQIDRNKLVKAIAVVVAILLFVGVASFFRTRNSVTLSEYAAQNGGTTNGSSTNGQSASAGDVSGADVSGSDVSGSDVSSSDVSGSDASNEAWRDLVLTGALLNGGADGMEMFDQRRILQTSDGQTEPDFYTEPLSDNLKRYITGVSYPDSENGGVAASSLAISLDELAYVHLLHVDFEGNPAQGELICNEKIAGDLLDIFYQLYRNGYQIEKVQLIDAYDGDDTLSMEDNNTSCFNYRVVEGSKTLSKHALGMAIDVNPLYNPYITYEKDGTQKVSPANAESYADRTATFPYKIDENDLCYKLFTQHGFVWGGNWNSVKDYQHFQKE